MNETLKLAFELKYRVFDLYLFKFLDSCGYLFDLINERANVQKLSN